MTRLAPALLAFLLAGSFASAHVAAQALSPSQPPPAVPTAVSQPAASGPLPDVITEYRLPPETLAKAGALHRTQVAMFVVGTVYGLAVLVLLLAMRVAPRLRNRAERMSAGRFVQALVFFPAFLLTLDVLSLPVSLYGHHLGLQYGLSVQGWPSWFWDWTKGELLGVTLGTLLIWGLYGILRRSPTRWWFYGWLAAIPVVLLLILIGPVFIAPVFNTFAPLETRQPQLIPALEQVMARGGLSIERARMFEMQASDKVTTYNAYVTGIGASKRVVVWDNTSRDLTIPETMFVFGHERVTMCCNTSGSRWGSRCWDCSRSCILRIGYCTACSRATAPVGTCAGSATGRRCRCCSCC